MESSGGYNEDMPVEKILDAELSIEPKTETYDNQENTGLSNPAEVEVLREKVYASLESYTKQKYPEHPGSPVCEGCHQPIAERFLLRVQNSLWHERCVKCAACSELLKGTCFLRDSKIYCRQDYKQSCVEVIFPAELVMRAGDAVFHLHCFCCSVCDCWLQKGDQCVLIGDKLLCAQHYQQTLSSITTTDSGQSEDEDDEDEPKLRQTEDRNPKRDLDHKRPKRPRTILTTQQKRAFKASFEVSSKPCRKMKKLARRQQQQQCQTPQDKDDSQTHTTGLSIRGFSAELRSPSSYLSAAGWQKTYSFRIDLRQGLTPPEMPGDHINPYVSVPDLSITSLQSLKKTIPRPCDLQSFPLREQSEWAEVSLQATSRQQRALCQEYAGSGLYAHSETAVKMEEANGV
ncbi:LIM homeobox transcription factor 1-beta [Bagarius yarrelli]|uniref:LIM homeobox transcription factor 1-beta n=1 Tax=Bagarius yarrelli TaxID=175774 RepID=A0A556V631_BAGYA|nr:LIM homeobox transcription factor 1-beta [Bagarius yarrelli]